MTSVREPEYYTVVQAARILDVSRTTVWRWVEEGLLSAYRIGPKTIRIRKGDLDALVQPARSKGARKTAPKLRTRLADENDIWKDYDPVKVRKAIREAAGALSGIDHKQLIRDIYEARGQASRGRAERED